MLAVASLLISVLKAKIDTLNETIYEVRPFRMSNG